MRWHGYMLKYNRGHSHITVFAYIQGSSSCKSRNMGSENILPKHGRKDVIP